MYIKNKKTYLSLLACLIIGFTFSCKKSIPQSSDISGNYSGQLTYNNTGPNADHQQGNINLILLANKRYAVTSPVTYFPSGAGIYSIKGTDTLIFADTIIRPAIVQYSDNFLLRGYYKFNLTGNTLSVSRVTATTNYEYVLMR